MSVKGINNQPSINWYSVDETKVYQEYIVDQIKALQGQVAMLTYKNALLEERVNQLEKSTPNRDISCLG